MLSQRGLKAKFSPNEIYDALFDEAAFAALPRRLSDLIGARSWLIGWMFPTGEQTLFAHSCYYSEQVMDLYVRDYRRRDRDPWTRDAVIARLRPGDVTDMTDIVPDAEWEGGAVYNELIRPLGDDMYRNVVLQTRDDSGQGCISFHRGKSQRGFHESGVGQLRTIAPQLTRMLSIHARLRASENKAASLRTMLDHALQPAILVRPSGTIIDSNAAGAALLGASGPLRLRDGHVEATNGGRMQLEAAISTAGSSSAPASVSLLLEDRQGQRIAVTAVPVRGLTGARQILLLAHPLVARNETVPAQLRALFGLTSSEAQIAARLSDGLAVAEIATERAVSKQTVRTQLKVIARKLGCSRQSEIVAVVRSLLPLPAGR